MAEDRSSLLPILVAVALAFGLLEHAVGEEQTRFDELALGAHTTSVFAEHEGRPIHVQRRAEFEALVEGARERAAPQQALWLGNSQLHAINQFAPGEQTASALVANRLRPRGVDVVTASFPNANLQEHLVAYSHLRTKLPRLNRVVIAVVFDDLREADVRQDLMPLTDNTATKRILEASDIGQRLLANAAVEGDAAATDADLAGVHGTFQERSERATDAWLDNHWSLWAARAEARGRIFSGLYTLRNTAFGITAESKRPLKKGPYRANMAALEAILKDATKHGVEVVVYVVPLRDDVPPPYILSEYQAFLEDAQDLTNRFDASYRDWSHLVPARFWGTKASTRVGGDGEVDFMHFQGEGHRLLADQVAEILEARLR